LALLRLRDDVRVYSVCLTGNLRKEWKGVILVSGLPVLLVGYATVLEDSPRCSEDWSCSLATGPQMMGRQTMALDALQGILLDLIATIVSIYAETQTGIVFLVMATCGVEATAIELADCARATEEV
jgi:hypothetical protein